MPRRLPTVAVAAAAAVAGAFAGARPAGTPVVDALLAAALVAAVAVLSARCHPAVLVVVAAAVVGAGAPLGSGLAAVALVLAAWQPVRWASSAAGGLLGLALLHLSWPDPFGATAVVAAAAVLVLVVGAWRRLPRGRVALGVVGLLVLGGVATAGFGLTVLQQRHRLELAVDAGEAGLGAARAGDAQTASQQLGAARDALAEARDALDRWWARPARVVPVVAQNARALDRALASVAVLADDGLTAAEAGDPERLQTADGGVDLAAVATLEGPLGRLEQSLDRVAGGSLLDRTGWVLEPLTRRTDELLDQAADARPQVGKARRAAAAAPWLLGADGPRRYFLAVVTPAELRGGGGLVGNWGVLTADRGRLALPRFGRIGELTRTYELTGSDEWRARYVDGWHVDRLPSNLLASPDLPTDAAAARQVARQAGLGDVDGMLVVDPEAVAALLQLTGPLTVDGWDEPLTSANAAEVLLHSQYLRATDPRRPDLLARTTQSLFDQLTSTRLPRPDALAAALGPQVVAGHLQLTVFDPQRDDYLRSIGLVPTLDPPLGDSLAVVLANSSGTKLDWYLHPSVTYAVHRRADGATTASLDVVLRNDAPADLPSPYFGGVDPGYPTGLNRMFVSVYTPLAATSATVDGRPVDLFASAEAGHRIHEAFVRVGPGQTATLHLELAGALPAGDYELALHRQPMVHPLDARVVVDGRVVRHGPLVHDEVVQTPGRKP